MAPWCEIEWPVEPAYQHFGWTLALPLLVKP